MKQLPRSVFVRTATVAAFLVACAAPVSAQEQNPLSASAYKAAEPKLDTSASEAQKSKMKGPLTGTVQKLDKTVPLRGGAAGKYGKSDPLRGRANDSLSKPLASQVQSSVGIIGVKFVATVGQPPMINQVFPGTPADQKGLRVYDRIVAVDGVPTAGLSKDEVFDLIVGSPGTQVTLSIMRGSDFQAVSCVRMDINELTDPRVRRDYMMNM